MTKPFILAALLSITSALSAQQQWTLRQCIDHALQNNISLKRQSNQNEQKAIQVSTARNARLPNLNASVGQDFSFGRGLTEDNTYTNSSTSSTRMGLSTSIPLFTGGRLPSQLRLAKLNLEAATADLQKAQDDLSLRVAQYYITAVYDRELLAVAQRQISIDSMQVARLQEMLRHGKASPVELSQQQATLENSRLTATKASNDLQLALLDLTQLLELSTPTGFSIATPVVTPLATVPDVSASVSLTPVATLPSPDAIYAEALGIKPEIAAEELRLKGTEASISIAKADLYPSLDLNGSIGTNYNKTSGFPAQSFGKQLENKFYQGIGITLNVPIFSRFATRNNIRSAEIDRQNQMLAVDEAKKRLYKEIQQVYYNTVAAESSFRSSQAAARSSEDAFELMRAKYEAGKANITEFNESKNNLLKAQSDLLRAKYEYLYQTALINFYRGKPLEM